MMRHNYAANDRQQDDEQHPQQQQQQQPVDIFLTHVPANLRAKFGLARCRELLADQAEVQRVWSRLATACDDERRRLPSRLPPLQPQPQPQPPMTTDWYADLSEQFNSDYSPGVAATRRLGHNHETHSEAVFRQSGDFNNVGPNAGRHKRRKDEFNAYNEVTHLVRKFNNQWARDGGGGGGGGSRGRRQPPAAVPPTQQHQPTSILSGRGGANGGSPPAKHVTTSEQNAGGGRAVGQQSLHRANTIQREDQTV